MLPNLPIVLSDKRGDLQVLAEPIKRLRQWVGPKGLRQLMILITIVHRRRLRVHPGHVPPNNLELPMHLSLLPAFFSHTILVFLPTIFAKSTPSGVARHFAPG